MGSLNYVKYSRTRKVFVFQAVFANSFEEIIAPLEAMNELGIKPEHECSTSGTSLPRAVVDMGVRQPPLHVWCVMGVRGGRAAHGAQPRGDGRTTWLAGSHWGVIGISWCQWTLRRPPR